MKFKILKLHKLIARNVMNLCIFNIFYYYFQLEIELGLKIIARNFNEIQKSFYETKYIFPLKTYDYAYATY